MKVKVRLSVSVIRGGGRLGEVPACTGGDDATPGTRKGHFFSRTLQTCSQVCLSVCHCSSLSLSLQCLEVLGLSRLRRVPSAAADWARSVEDWTLKLGPGPLCVTVLQVAGDRGE